MASRNQLMRSPSFALPRSIRARAAPVRSFADSERRKAMMAQLRAQRSGMRTFGFFSSIGKAIGGLAKRAVSSLPVVGPAVSLASEFLGTVGRSEVGLVSPDQGAQSFAPVSKLRGAATAGRGCPTGFKLVRGRCVRRGVGGTLQRLIPGGETGVLSDEFGNAVMGGFGVAALEPAMVGNITRRDGTQGVILRCPRGTILAIDNLCYNKSVLPVKFRKWRPAPKGPISAKDWRTVKTFDSVQKKVKTLASDSGLTCAKKGTGRKKKG